MSMRNLTSAFSTTKTPQNQAIPGTDQVPNSAGGFSWAVDQWTQLDRFLILGTEGGSYYASAPKLTADNAKSALGCVKADGVRTVNRLVEISDAGRAPKNTPALFVLAMALKLGDADTKRAAQAALPKIARIGTHLFQLADAIRAFGGWGRGTKRSFGNWYTDRVNQESLNRVLADDSLTNDEKEAAHRMIQLAGPRSLAYQAVKYQSRDGWSHRDVLRLAKPKGFNPGDGGTGDVLKWITKGWDAVPTEVPTQDDPTRIIWAFEKAKAIGAEQDGKPSKARTKDLIKLIVDYGLPRECIPTQYLNEVSVWDALLTSGRGMPFTAMIRNLPKMTASGLLAPMSDASGFVVKRLMDEEGLKKARVHPLQVLVALNTYKGGKGIRGSLTWNPVSQIVDALDRAFYLSFGAVESTGKRWCLGLDVSGSMGWGQIAGLPGITPMVGSAAMAMVTAATEPQHVFTAFSHKLVPVNGLSPRMRLDSVVAQLSQIPMGGTDCALPMLWALENKVPVDTFAVYTDSETWFGSVHPKQALDQYRQKMGIDARLIVVGMTANNFTIADPNDAGMLDVVGFDTAAPNIMASFAKGEF